MISKRTRFEILKRDGYRCRYCGRSAPEVQLTVDHVKARARGGDDRPHNLVTACSDCNTGKSDIPLTVRTLAGTRARDYWDIDDDNREANAHVGENGLDLVDPFISSLYGAPAL